MVDMFHCFSLLLNYGSKMKILSIVTVLVFHSLGRIDGEISSLCPTFWTSYGSSCYSSDADGHVFAGLANGNLVVYDVRTLRNKEGSSPNHNLNLNANSVEPIGCIQLAKSKIWVGCGSHVVILNANTLSVEGRLVPVSHNNNSGERRPGMVKCLTVDKSVWLCRRNSSIIEVWDPGKEQIKTTINVAHLIEPHYPQMRPQESHIKSILRQDHSTIWLGTAGGYLVLVDNHTSKLITVISRHIGELRAMVSLKGHGSNVVVTAGMGFVQRPGDNELTDEVCSHILVWDLHLKAQARYLQHNDGRRKKNGNTWNKVLSPTSPINLWNSP